MERGSHKIQFFIDGRDRAFGSSQKKSSGHQTRQTLLAGGIFPGSGIYEKLECDKGQGMLFREEEDKFVG
jgi:hypothetical protein